MPRVTRRLVRRRRGARAGRGGDAAGGRHGPAAVDGHRPAATGPRCSPRGPHEQPRGLPQGLAPQCAAGESAPWPAPAIARGTGRGRHTAEPGGVNVACSPPCVVDRALRVRSVRACASSPPHAAARARAGAVCARLSLARGLGLGRARVTGLQRARALVKAARGGPALQPATKLLARPLCAPRHRRHAIAWRDEHFDVRHARRAARMDARDNADARAEGARPPRDPPPAPACALAHAECAPTPCVLSSCTSRAATAASAPRRAARLCRGTYARLRPALPSGAPPHPRSAWCVTAVSVPAAVHPSTSTRSGLGARRPVEQLLGRTTRSATSPSEPRYATGRGDRVVTAFRAMGGGADLHAAVASRVILGRSSTTTRPSPTRRPAPRCSWRGLGQHRATTACAGQGEPRAALENHTLGCGNTLRGT
jgi:hypothetical protein